VRGIFDELPYLPANIDASLTTSKYLYIVKGSWLYRIDYKNWKTDVGVVNTFDPHYALYQLTKCGIDEKKYNDVYKPKLSKFAPVKASKFDIGDDRPIPRAAATAADGISKPYDNNPSDEYNQMVAGATKAPKGTGFLIAAALLCCVLSVFLVIILVSMNKKTKAENKPETDISSASSKGSKIDSADKKKSTFTSKM